MNEYVKSVQISPYGHKVDGLCVSYHPSCYSASYSAPVSAGCWAGGPVRAATKTDEVHASMAFHSGWGERDTK